MTEHDCKNCIHSITVNHKTGAVLCTIKDKVDVAIMNVRTHSRMNGRFFCADYEERK